MDIQSTAAPLLGEERDGTCSQVQVARGVIYHSSVDKNLVSPIMESPSTAFPKWL
jgi:hypothetical protein